MTRKFGRLLILGGVVLSIANCGSLFSRSKVNYNGMKAIHEGWSGVQALGGRQPVSQAAGLATTSPTVTLSWNAMSFPYASIDSYNIYRSTTSGGQDFTKPLATGISPAALTYTDTTVATSTTYYYTVRPVVTGYALATTEADTEIKVMVPPTNMALVHRWMANLEMCSNLMGRTPDRANNYRCSYTGPMNINGYYDYGHNQFWDVFEVGCNYTPPNSNSSLSCGSSTNGCLSTGAPSTGGPNQTHYDRTGWCRVWVTGTTWAWAGAGGSASSFAQAASNSPGLPPLIRMDQASSQLACQQFQVNGIAKRLPKHSERIVASAWDSKLNDSTIDTIENGISLPQTGDCNSNSGSGLTFDSNATPSDLETLPGSIAAIRSVRTGSLATKNCISRYGIQDLVGNVAEWDSDQLNLCIGNSCFANGLGSIDSANQDWYWSSGSLPINFDGTIAPGGTVISSWIFSVPQYNATRFLPTLGLPMVSTAPTNYDSLQIGNEPGQFKPDTFHNDIMVLSSSITSVRGARGGGSYGSGSGCGRFFLTVSWTPSSYDYGTGFRCMLDAD